MSVPFARRVKSILRKCLPALSWRGQAVARSACHLEHLERRQLLTTYYVSPSGNDWSAGTNQWQPWQSINRVNNQTLKAGDQVLFQGGQNFWGSLQVQSWEGGNAWQPVTFGSYGWGRATINSGWQTGLDVKQAGGISVSNLNFRGAGMYSNNTNGISFH